jgi:ubiquitin carboxyl-terminal hydrolase 14
MFSWLLALRCSSALFFQRKVKFPNEFDALDLVTDELKGKMMPVSRRLKEVEKERAERRKVRKRTKVVKTTKDKDVEMGDATAVVLESVPSGSTTETTAENTAASASTATTGEEGKGKEIAVGELEEESVYRQNEIKELDALVDPELKNDVGCSLSGLYDLVGERFTLLFLFRPSELS